MASRDNKPAKASSSGAGRIRTLADLNRRTGPGSDSDEDAPQEYYTGGEKSGQLVQGPSKGNNNNNNDVDAIFEQARRLGAVEGGPLESNLHASSTSFTGTAKKLSGDTVPPPAPREAESAVHNIVFWSNGFTVNDGPLRLFDDPENASFLESMRKSELPKELKRPANLSMPLHINLIRRDENCPEPEQPHVPFQGIGRTLGRSSSQPATNPNVVPSSNSATSPPTTLVVDETLPTTSIQLRLANGTRIVAQFNYNHTINDIRRFIDSSQPEGARNYQLQLVGFPPKVLTDHTQTIEQAGLRNSVVIQKF